MELLKDFLEFLVNFKATDLKSIFLMSIFLFRQLSGLVIESSHMDGFLSHIQNEVKEKTIKEEPHLHIYSNNDIDM